METIVLSRSALVPDKVRIARFKKAPELGPKILFFSGGSALNPLSKALIGYTHNSIHLVTPFDSGGSSRALRKAFNMPAVGDARSRLMALADQSVTGAPDIYRLFAYRFPKDEDAAKAKYHLEKMVQGKDPLVSAITDPMRKIIRAHLKFFMDKAPEDFSLAGASVGNLILAGGYLNYSRRLDPVIFLFSRLVEARGVVRPIVGAPLHLAVELEDGRVIAGQHLITGKEAPPITSPVKKIFLVKTEDNGGKDVFNAIIREKTRQVIAQADLICYPMGSYYSSLIANLLPKGVGAAISSADCPKIFIPNTGSDPEQNGMTLTGMVRTLITLLKKNRGGSANAERLLNFILVDSKNGSYQGKVETGALNKMGVRVIDTPLVTERSYPYLDEERIIEVLLSLV